DGELRRRDVRHRRLDEAEHQAATSLYPEPRTVTSRSGWVGSRSIFRLKFEMCTSHACSSPTYSLDQRCCMSSRRETTEPGCSARSDSTLNSESVRWTRSPSTSTS